MSVTSKQLDFMRTVRRMFPKAQWNAMVHDEIQISGVDLKDPHFLSHWHAFVEGRDGPCDHLDCVVDDVHEW